MSDCESKTTAKSLGRRMDEIEPVTISRAELMDMRAEIEALREAVGHALSLLRNPYDGGEYEDGEFPAVDVLRKALS